LASTKNVVLDENNWRRYFQYMTMTPAQCRAARGFLDISQEELAKASNVGLSTVRDFEKGRRVPIGNNLAAMRAALETRGITFVNGDEADCVLLTHGPT
jgi:DNA-binding transcriptional regulator YiaG